MAKINSTLSNTLLSGTSGDDSINNGGYWDSSSHYGGSNVTINTGAGNDSVDNWGDSVTIDTGAGNDSVWNDGDSVTINTGEGNDSVRNYDGSSVTINTGAGNDYVDNLVDTVTINTGAGNDSILNYGDSVTISGGKGNDEIYNNCYRNKYDGNIYYYDDYGSNVLFNYASGDGNDTIWGFKADSTLSIGGGSYSTKQSSDDIIVTVGKGKITLVGAASLSAVNITGTQGSDEKNDWKLSGTTATYGTSSNTLITITGVKSLSGISLSGSTVTVAQAALNQSNVTLSGSGYTLKLASDVSTSAATSNTWSYSNSVATLKQTKGEKYSLASDGKSISYSAGTSSTLATISGVKSADGLSLSGKKITVAASALNKAKVTLKGSGYKLKLASDVSTTAATSNDWSYSNSVATLKQTKGEKYSLASDGKSITYSAGTSSTLATVSGVKSADGLSLKKKVITIAQAALNQSNVTLKGSGYKLKLASDVSTTATTSNAWSYKSSVATLKQTKGEKYSLASDGKSISYSAGTSSTLATISGVKSAGGLSLSGNKITLKNSALKNKVTVSGGYEFDFASDYKKATITGSDKADTITTRGNNISVTGGKGNDIINLAATAKNNLIVYKSGDGKDIINGLSEDDTIKIASGAAQVSASGSDVIFTVGKGSITVKDAAEKNFVYIAGGVKETYSAVAAEPYTISGAEIVLSSSYTKNDFDVADYGEGLKTIDASAVTHALNITGNDNDNKILGTSGNDTLDGYTGDDTLTGGAGSDIFLYYENDGNDVITDYAKEDIIQLDTAATPTTKGRDVVLKVGKGKITVQNAAKNKIGVTYFEKGVEHDYINGKQAVAVINKNVKITKDYWKNNFDVKNFGEDLKQIDASAVTHKLKITGNDKANQILGGTGNDTLIGGKGNDTLQGGDGSNLYVYNNGDGNDLIVSWGNRDSISIASGVLSDITVKDDTAILKVGKGKISLQGALTEQLNWYDSDGETHHTILGGASDNVLEDDNFITGNGNNLNTIVEDKAVDYSVAEMESALPPANALPALSYSKKKSPSN